MARTKKKDAAPLITNHVSRHSLAKPEGLTLPALFSSFVIGHSLFDIGYSLPPLPH